MRKKILFFFISILSILNTVSQNRKFLYGTIKDKIGPIINAHIINKNTNQGTFTNESGEFRILAKVNDSLKISFVGYKTIVFSVKVPHFGIQKTVFELLKTTYELDEVDLNKNHLLGFLSSDSKNIKSKKKINAKTLKLPYAGSKTMTPAERKLHTATGGSTPFSIGLANAVSVDYILNSISGRIKKLRKLKVIESLEVKIEKIKNTYSIHIIKEYQIKKIDIYKFIYFCSADEKFNQIFNLGDIHMIRFLKKKAEVFKKLNPNDYN